MRLLALLFLVLSLLSCQEKSMETAETIRPVKYAKVELATGMETYTFSGVAKAQNETNLSFKVAGILSSVKVKLGDQVKKGQLIATIDPADYTIQTNQAVSQKEGAVANSKAAEAQLISAKATYDRVAQLYENNSVALSEYQQAKAALDAAKAQYDAANSQIKTTDQQLKAAGNQVSYTRLVSPMDGVITAVQVEANEVVNAGTLIAMVSSLGRPEVEVGVPEVVINKLKIGQQATIQFPSLPKQLFEAEVVEIAFASEKSTTYPVILKIMNSADEIRPGMAAEVKFRVGTDEGKTKNEMVAPLKAIASGTDGNYAFQLVPDQEEGVYVAKRVPLDLGAITEDGYGYIIKKGLSAGDLVAVAGLRSLYDGKKVKLLEN
ncbi:MAG: efflux RND transporter periplasmic adaptor subunit [Saprospiraceae bacterium]|nr:efflux RND transporter periplasmic adaptor subunit [Saprospiraceae bacterium]